MTIATERHDRVLLVTIDRYEARNAIDRPHADALEQAFRDFDVDGGLDVAVLTGAGGVFCAGADLEALANDHTRVNRLDPGEHAPMGPTRLALSKPVVAAVEGHAVAGGLELALWCDLRVAAEDAVFGVFNRRWGVPLMDGGTVRLPRIVGYAHAMDLILTGRPVSGAEALRLGLANRLTPAGAALDHALTLAAALAALPQDGLRSDRRSVRETLHLPLADALAREHALGAETLATGEAIAGATRFSRGAGRHGAREGPIAG